MPHNVLICTEATPGGAQKQVSPTNPVPVTGSGQGGYRSIVTITRPSNTTPYTAGDVVGQADVSVAANAGTAILEFTSVGPAGGHVLITSIDFEIDVTAVPSGMGNFTLALYDSSPTAILDNAVWDFPSGDRGKLMCRIPLGTPVDLGSTLYVSTDRTSHQGQAKLATDSTSIYGELITDAGWTPASGTVLVIRMRTVAL